jgi:FkbM family methyltransferase
MTSLITPEMHELTRAHVELFPEKGYTIKGIVHVGANIGQEIPWYLDKLYLPIIVFEPHPIAFMELHRIYNKVAMCNPFALGSKSDNLILHIPADGNHERSSKYLPVETQGHDWTKVPMSEEITVPVVRFDTWYRNHDHLVNISAYNALVVDVQGMELEVLKGFGNFLQGFEYLVVECSAVPVYDGEASAQEVIDYLKNKGFTPLTPIEEHDDIYFRKIYWR